MNLLSGTFYAFEILAAVSATAILFTRNVFHAALLLIICLLSLAGIFVIANAEFIAATQILVYAGGVLILIIFGIMLTSKITGKSLVVTNHYIFPGSVIAVLFLTVLLKFFSESVFYQETVSQTSSPYTSINTIGISLMSDYVLMLEVAGILLLVALVGAAVTASSFNAQKKL